MTKQIVLFNSPLESGLRTLLILTKSYPKPVDTQRLIYYTYLTLHTSDFTEKASLHPSTPNRSCQIVVQRAVLQGGLLLLQLKDLIDTKYTATGIAYKANKSAVAFTDNISSSYAQEFNLCVDSVLERFGGMSDKQLNAFVTENLTKWGSEFVDEGANQ